MGPMEDYQAAGDRYDTMEYRHRARAGSSSRHLAGAVAELRRRQAREMQRAILRRAFDRGVTHFDLANNYGPPYGQAETNFGHFLKQDLMPYRDEMADLHEGRLRHVAGATARAAARASTCWPASTSR